MNIKSSLDRIKPVGDGKNREYRKTARKNGARPVVWLLSSREAVNDIISGKKSLSQSASLVRISGVKNYPIEPFEVVLDNGTKTIRYTEERGFFLGKPCRRLVDGLWYLV